MTKTGLGLEGRNVAVVGAGSGIGYETAMLLGHVGANVAAVDIDAGRAAEVSAEIVELGVHGAAVGGDVTDEDQAIRAIDEAAEALGALDAVVNIVGFAAWVKLLDVDAHVWDLDIRRNLTHHLYVSRAAARRWIADGSGGAIAVVASVSGIYGAPHHAAYGAAKAGLMDLVRTMSQEWGPHGIRVNAVAPDMIATPRVVAAREAAGGSADRSSIDERLSLRRVGLPSEIAGPLVFLVSDLASFLTGQTLVVDGGTMAAFPHVTGTSRMPRGTGE